MLKKRKVSIYVVFVFRFLTFFILKINWFAKISFTNVFILSIMATELFVSMKT
jgi:hypothetical protein